MSKRIFNQRRLALAFVVLGLALGGAPAKAEEAFVTFKVLNPEIALELARATLANCRD